MARLELRKIKHVSRLDFSDRPVTIGRSSQNVIVLEDTHVSRKHCVIEVIDGKTHLRDLQSHGGTFINGRRITDSVLHHGDRVSIGPFDLVFKDPLAKAGPESDAIDEAADHGTPNGSSAGDHPAVTIAPPKDDGELESLRAEVAQLTEDRAADKQRIAELELAVETERGLTESQQQSIDEVAAQLIAAQNQMAELKSLAEKTLRDHQAAAGKAQQTEAELSEAHATLESAQQELVASLRQIDELTSSVASLQRRLDELESRSRQDLTRARDQLQAASREIDRLKSHEITLQEQVDALEESRRMVTEQADHSARALVMLRGQIQSLDDAAQRVSGLQNRLAEIEAAWLEADQQIDEAEADAEDPEKVEAAALQRHAISSELEALNQQRDAAVARLRESAEHLRALTERQILPVLTTISPAKVKSSSDRRWWKFGK